MQDGTLLSPGHPQDTAPLRGDGFPMHGGALPPRGDAYARECPTRTLLDRVGDKWSVLILLLLGDEDMRFNGLKRRIGGVSQKMLSQTLRSLERDGLLRRDVTPSTPVSVTYRITPLGRELLGALRLMIDWAETRMPTVLAHQADYDARQWDVG